MAVAFSAYGTYKNNASLKAYQAQVLSSFGKAGTGQRQLPGASEVSPATAGQPQLTKPIQGILGQRGSSMPGIRGSYGAAAALKAIRPGAVSLDNIDSGGEIGDNSNVNKGVKFFRVQSGVEPNRSKYRVIVSSDGDVKIPDKTQNLYISVGTSEHALYFKAKRGEGAVIIEFEAPMWLYNFLKENAIDQRIIKIIL